MSESSQVSRLSSSDLRSILDGEGSTVLVIARRES
jgi:hypothetical protein